jgi:N-carbamoylputrescine amidase
MRVTVCELPHESASLAAAWHALREHTRHRASELVLLPEFAMVDAVWEGEQFDLERWEAAESLSDAWLERLPELCAAYVVGTRPRSADGQRFNEGFAWSRAAGVESLRRKYFLPNEPGGWEARWFDRGDASFPVFRAGDLSFGLNICTELWALETYAAYAGSGVQIVLSPRATAAATTEKWMAVGVAVT